MKVLTRKMVVKNGLSRPSVQEVDVADSSDKALKRYAIQEIRGDIYDILADALKWNSMLTTMVSELYAVIPEEQKALMDSGKKALIDEFIAEFKDTPTRADKQFAKEGANMLKRVLERERKVGELF